LARIESENVVKRGRHVRLEASKWLAKMQNAFFFSKWASSIESANVTFAPSFSSRRKPFNGLKTELTCLPQDVLDRLDLDPDFVGIRSLSGSQFWKLIEAPLLTLDEAISFVQECLKRLGLVRLTVGLEEEWLLAERLLDSHPTKDEVDLAWESLQKIVDMKPLQLDVVALIGGLYREAYLSYEFDAAKKLGVMFWCALEDFLMHPQLQEMDSGFLDYAVNRILFGRSDEEAMHGMNPYRFPRLLDRPVGILLPGSDPKLQEFLKVRGI